VYLTRLSPLDLSPASLLFSKLEFGRVVFPMHSSHVVHNCSAMCLRDLILAVIVPAVTNHMSYVPVLAVFLFIGRERSRWTSRIAR